MVGKGPRAGRARRDAAGIKTANMLELAVVDGIRRCLGDSEIAGITVHGDHDLDGAVRAAMMGGPGLERLESFDGDFYGKVERNLKKLRSGAGRCTVTIDAGHTRMQVVVELKPAAIEVAA
ncbi:MAG: hypothetical protein MPK62_00110 [Alphaproteobacteria bacterium]|nr:hypothetical protein [Alphaproteobacteria bacterium]MDA8029540.1 hypothetical protein [Alphaproteobacteria bacterium]